MKRRIALIGGRGYTGGELLRLTQGHPQLELALASSWSRGGEPIAHECPEWLGDELFVALEPQDVDAYEADAWVLALPNGMAGAWAEQIIQAHPDAVIVDLTPDRV